MALMTRSAFGQLSGRLGGTEFAIHKGRSIVKQAKSKPIRVTPKRARAQNAQAAAIAHWHSLTDAQRLAWNQAAQLQPVKDRFGTRTYRNGFQLFLTIPHDFTYTEIWSWMDEPPTTTTLNEPNLSVDIFAGASFYVYTSIWGALTGVTWVYFSRWRPQNSNRRAYSWKLLGPVDTTSTTQDFLSVVAAENILFVEGERVAVRVGCCDNFKWPVVQDAGIVTVQA